MKTHMIFYWYVPLCGWHKIYDLHIKNLEIYANRFDKVTFVISCDENSHNDYKTHINMTIERLKSICNDADFIKYKNDSTLRESYYFYNEIVNKLDSFGDEIIFFAHNKGVATWYETESSLNDWINVMYFENLNDIESIKNLFKDTELCSVGTYKISSSKPWSFLKYKWHYSGSYFWMCPKRIYSEIIKNNEVIPNVNRYFAEGFLGSVIDDVETKTLGLLGNYEGHAYSKWPIERMSKEEFEKYNLLYKNKQETK